MTCGMALSRLSQPPEGLTPGVRGLEPDHLLGGKVLLVPLQVHVGCFGYFKYTGRFYQFEVQKHSTGPWSRAIAALFLSKQVHEVVKTACGVQNEPCNAI
jgi:hypothetical protein